MKKTKEEMIAELEEVIGAFEEYTEILEATKQEAGRVAIEAYTASKEGNKKPLMKYSFCAIADDLAAKHGGNRALIHRDLMEYTMHFFKKLLKG